MKPEFQSQDHIGLNLKKENYIRIQHHGVQAHQTTGSAHVQQKKIHTMETLIKYHDLLITTI